MICPTCNFNNPSGMKFCGNCGTALTTAGAEERKLVTVVFIDLVDSSRFAAAADPEQWREQVARFFAIVRQEIERFGGTVEKFIGDAVMAVFGLPAVHEDDPERAVRASAAVRPQLQPLRETGRLPDVRIGIYTGEVIANPGALDKGEFLVTGETVNLAARLQQHAAPGQILIGERTGLAVRHAARLRPLPPLSVKGAAAPIPVCELLEVLPPRERELQPTPFVGREDELELLAGHVRRTRRDGRGHVMTILGAGGVGKTRLVAEFRARTRDVHTLRGRALPYGTGVPFWSLGEVIREECGILFGDPLETARRKVEDTIQRLGVVATAAPALRVVLALGGENFNLTRDALFAGMRAFFQALARQDPLLLILEDVHSAEDVTLDFLEHAADWVREASMLLMILSRPELLERRPSWLGGKRSATTLFLDPLGVHESRALALGILEGRPAPGAFIDMVLERAGGNPLFMEEMLRALIEQRVLLVGEGGWSLAVPADQVTIPDTVHAVIAARIDALPPADKHVLQAAAVVGKDFWRGALESMGDDLAVGAVLDGLVSKDLLARKPVSSLIGETEFTFRHILIRDTAYTMIPKAQRWPKHALHAGWLQRIAGDRQAEYADFISYHWLQVLALRRELGLPLDPNASNEALANLLLAGDRAAGVYANTIALDHYTRALDLDPPIAERLRALQGRGNVWLLLAQFDRARDDFEALRNAAQEADDSRWLAMAFDLLGHSYRRQDQIAPALEHLARALAMSRAVGDPVLTARILNHLGFTYYSDGRHEEALEVHQEACALLERHQDDRSHAVDMAESLHGLGENLLFLGRNEESITHLTASIDVSERVGNRSLAMENRYMVAYARSHQARYAEALAESRRSVGTLEEIGDVWNLSVALMVASGIALATGDLGEAVKMATRGSALARQIEALRFTTFNLQVLAEVYLEIEDAQSARQAGSEAAVIARGTRGGWLPQILAGVARSAIRLGMVDEADAALREARKSLEATQTRVDFPCHITEAEGRLNLAKGRPLDAWQAARALTALAEDHDMRHWSVPAMLLEADALLALDAADKAAQRYEEATREAERVGRPPMTWRALAGLAEARRRLGRSEAATEAAERATQIVERLAATLDDERLRATFVQSERVQEVKTLAGG